MYVSSTLHDASHEDTSFAADLTDLEICAVGDHEHHVELGCFFCAHVPVLNIEDVSQEGYTSAERRLEIPADPQSPLYSVAILLPGLRAPPVSAA